MKPPRDYFDLLDAIHRTTIPRTYVEIGVATGKSLSLALPGTTLVGVDPAANVRHPVSGALHIFRQTSDDFFASGALHSVLNGLTVDVSFIDGLHHFDAVLKDFRNLETASSTASVIVIHDCIPPESVIASRERQTRLWTGDVWKAVLGLRDYRPELNISILDVPPTGIAIVTGLQPQSRLLFDRYEEICSELSPRSLPETRADLKTLLGFVSFDWTALRGQLPSVPFRDEPLDGLLRQRRMRRPTWAQIEWKVRRAVRYSPAGYRLFRLRYTMPLPAEDPASNRQNAGLD